MSEEWRLVEQKDLDAYTNMAIDEAMLYAKIEGLIPNTLRLYTWNPSAVSIGYFQSMVREVNLERCKALGVDVVRRITGGGAVYHGCNAEVTYSLVLSESDPRVAVPFSESFRVLSEGILLALRGLGLEGNFKPVNDVIVNGRKISGNAQTRRGGVIMQHGTLLVRSDPTMFEVLIDRPIGKDAPDIRARITSLDEELGRRTALTDVTKALQEGFGRGLNVSLVEGALTSFEERESQSRMGKYRSPEWNLCR